MEKKSLNFLCSFLHYLGPKTHFKHFFFITFFETSVPTSMGTWLTLMKGLMGSMGQIWPRVKNPWGKSGHHFLIIVELSKFVDMFIQ